MELRQYLFLLRRWLWLLILGLVIGSVGAYVFSLYQPLVYQTTTKIMVLRAPDERISDYSAMNDYQLARTYSQLINTEPVLQAVREKLGFDIESRQLSVKQIPDSLLMELTVRDNAAGRAAMIANTLVEVFIEYNDSLQSSRFASSEQSLQAQIAQVDEQIKAIQSEMTQLSAETLQTQQQQVEARIAELEDKISGLEDEVNALLPTTTPQVAEETLAVLSANPVTPEPTATFSAAQQASLKQKKDLLEEKQNQLSQLKSTLNLYQQVYLNLLVFGEGSTNGSRSNRQDQLQATLALYQQIYSNLLNNYEEIRLARLRSTPNIVQIEQARIPEVPIQPQPFRNAALGGASGLLIMGAIAFLIEYLDDTLKTPEDVSRLLGLPVIGLIGEMEGGKSDNFGAYVAKNPRSPIAEAFRTLRTNLDFAGVDKPLKTLLITSAGPSEGKTTTAINLAVVMSQGERKVALVDSDLRRPAIHRFLQLPNNLGLTDIFRSHDGMLDEVSTWGDNPITVITSGALPPNPTELLGSEKMTRILEKLTDDHDMVILDSPPFFVADPVVLSAKVDGVLLVIEPGSTKIESAQAMLEQLQRAGARVVGVVLNPISRKRAHYYYGKYRYSSYYYYNRGYEYYVGTDGSRKKRKTGSYIPKKPV